MSGVSAQNNKQKNARAYALKCSVLAQHADTCRLRALCSVVGTLSYALTYRQGLYS